MNLSDGDPISECGAFRTPARALHILLWEPWYNNQILLKHNMAQIINLFFGRWEQHRGGHGRLNTDGEVRVWQVKPNLSW